MRVAFDNDLDPVACLKEEDATKSLFGCGKKCRLVRKSEGFKRHYISSMVTDAGDRNPRTMVIHDRYFSSTRSHARSGDLSRVVQIVLSRRTDQRIFLRTSGVVMRSFSTALSRC